MIDVYKNPNCLKIKFSKKHRTQYRFFFKKMDDQSSSTTRASQSSSNDRNNGSSSNQSGSGGVGGTESNFDCNICLDTAKDAVISMCGHLFW